MIQHLEKKGATVKILTEDGRFKGLFFSTADMKRSMNAWPEVVFIDGTYLLLRINLTVMILLVEDSNASSELVGVALLAEEDHSTFTWFLETFKNENSSACARINCLMGDKDLLERDVLKDVFPGVPVYICLFHTLKIFSREVTLEKMDDPKQTTDGVLREKQNESRNRKVNGKKIQRDNCLKILQKLAYSSSEIEYEKHYLEFEKAAPAVVLDYYKKNWHWNKEEWTCYSMTSGNLFNRTNNRLESINAKIKQVVRKCSTLVDFADSFFAFLESNQHQVDLKTARSFTRRRTDFYSAESDENKFMELRTHEAFKYVSIELQAHEKISVDEQNDSECLVTAGDLTFRVTSSACECGISRSSLLPCRHIFVVRKHFELPLFADDLCNARWTKAYCMKHQRSFQKTAESNEADNVPKRTVITELSAPEASTVASQKKLLVSVTGDLKTTCSQSCSSDFTYKLEIIRTVRATWERSIEISIHTNGKKRSSSSEQSSVEKGANRKKQSVQEKRKVIEPLVNELIAAGLNVSGEKFKQRVGIIRKIDSSWRRQLNVCIEEIGIDGNTLSLEKVLEHCPTPDAEYVKPSTDAGTSADSILRHEELVERFKQFMSVKCISDHELSRIEMPVAMQRKGRPSGSMITWVNIKKHHITTKPTLRLYAGNPSQLAERNGRSIFIDTHCHRSWRMRNLY